MRRIPGTKISNHFSGQVIYTPPEGESVILDKLGNLERFLYADNGLDVLVKMAVMHYQFEAIHPFSDGNGRSGRILNILYLVDQKCLDFPVLYLSRFIIQNKADYYSRLRAVTEEGAWQDWVLYMLQAVELTAVETRDKILAIRLLMSQVAEQVRLELPKVYRKELIELLFGQPYCKINSLIDAGIARRQTASDYLWSLEQLGVLRAVKVGREWYFINTKFFELLTRW